ncbi:pectate lyase [Saccharicrinis sp. FJH54]|uniref:pectate lyase n=1 Tax=Saccharicrinis sp. FJH54 TaxID=3344665 RepID=UPI0035D4618F
MIEEALLKLKNYIESQNYRGYDPYDALNSPLFKLPVLKSNKLIRFGSQQLVKRFPLNLRPLLFIKKGINPVTLGLCIQAYAYLYEHDKKNKQQHFNKIEALIENLEMLIPEGYSGACWGYNFDWEARYARIPSLEPTVVATGIITNALYIANEKTGIKKAADLVVSASAFVTKDLKRTTFADGICFSYSPFDRQTVFNASMKGVRILAQAYKLTQNVNLRDLGEKAVDFVVSHQNENGSWPYALANKGDWSDSYHTGYVLDCLDDFQKLTGVNKYNPFIKNGYEYFIQHFIIDDQIPAFYDYNQYPVDCTAASQIILTTSRFGDMEIAKNIALWTINKMQKSNGSFKFRMFKNYVIHNSFMRWSDAWMFAALSKIYEKK